jgi:hypothetical protein
MQLLVSGYLVSLVLWTILVVAALKVTLKLYESGSVAEKWLLLVPFVFAYIVFFGIRYRFAPWIMDRSALHQFFSIGAYMPSDLFVFLICLPILYMISIMRPDWVVRTWVNLPLLVLLPFVFKLFFYATGLIGWDPLGAQMMPTRPE